MTMSPGTIVGGYRIIRVLGAGGMGTVYLAKHPSLPRMDALKVLSGDLSRNPEFRGRFEREANVVAALHHPNIVAVHNRGEENGQLWIAMQYVDGTDASAEAKRDPAAMTPLRALRITTEIGKGLDYAHRNGLLHRDIKPANFLLTTDGDDERALLADFGVAKSTEDTTELTQTGSFVATVAYASPEQLAGDPLDHRSDIYSLACAFYRLLTGQNPYPSTQPAIVMVGHLQEPPPRATAVNPHLPPAIDHVFAIAMAKNPADRYNTCRDFTDAATNALIPGHNPTGTNTSPTYPIQVAPPSLQAPTSRTATHATAFTGHSMAHTAQSGTAPTMPPGKPKRRKGIYLGIGAAAVAAALAVGIGAVVTRGDAGTDVATVTTSAAAVSNSATTLEDARKNNPAFNGKVITMIDVPKQLELSIYLGGTSQTNFLEQLGFVYNFNYARNGDEPNPRPDSNNWQDLQAAESSYLLVIRSDEDAGGGGLMGLGSRITGTRATVIAVDDPAVVAAVRTWSPGSEKVLLDKLVPILRKTVK
ncbi:serine/threonine protein kinase [Nocardia huaxiensis]|uniref:non-specific serine/threonine protein kinase n=1 Tax=Nocardia huaxiensis TaxID=2755382 RepID=A0A7D6VCS9_9NOCA|nr:serine/threonine-protein kinase [Nocardia huaxiensis]QLY31913.1 serine/threonine protein kinase [Nocardia huaxiensis]